MSSLRLSTHGGTKVSASLGIAHALITQSTLERIGGSEVQAYELAAFLSEQGVDVTIYTWFANSPMLDILLQAGVNVIQRGTEEEMHLHLNDFDLIWVQHETLPESIIVDLLSGQVSDTTLIFSHMSPFEEIRIEFPYIYDFENRFSDLSVFNSPSTLEAQRSSFPANFARYAIYPNPAPTEFALSTANSHDAITSILVVSNHRPPELDEAIIRLRASGITVDLLQDVQGNTASQITNEEILSRYDVIISIGKTVQYCLTMGKPAFIYDQFGGPGYLNDRNFDIIAFHNFSGRTELSTQSLVQSKMQHTSMRMNAQDIVRNIVEGYDEARRYHIANRTRFIKRYSIDQLFPALIKRAQSNSERIHETLSEHYSTYVIHDERAIANFIVRIQQLNNPVSEFYHQQCQIFYSADGQFSEDQSDTYPKLRQHMEITLPDSRTCYYRIDFGEQPCVIRIHDSDSPDATITSNAVFQYHDWMVFTSPDPQIYCRISGERPITITADIFPISHIPDKASREFANTVSDRIRQGDEAINRLAYLANRPWFRIAGHIHDVIHHFRH